MTHQQYLPKYNLQKIEEIRLGLTRQRLMALNDITKDTNLSLVEKQAKHRDIIQQKQDIQFQKARFTWSVPLNCYIFKA